MRRCHAVSTFFIERASQVNCEDPGWKFMILLRSSSSSNDPTLVGFTSIYEFRKPIKNVRSFRICVMLVLPPYQNQRLGEHMLRAVYREACSHEDVTEVTGKVPLVLTFLKLTFV